MDYEIRLMTMADYDEVYALWQASEGIGLSAADERAGIARFLERNPGLAFVARAGTELAGAVLVGDDGRRGYLHHLAVSAAHRRRGLGQALVDRCLSALSERGIRKCHIFVYGGNQGGLAFWEEVGFYPRPELVLMSHDVD
jgi:ribosomal protein S18 acetylase RimI-like enzyme